MKNKTIETYNNVSNRIQELELIRDYTTNWTEEHELLLTALYRFWEDLRQLPGFYEPDIERYIEGSEEEQATEELKFQMVKYGVASSVDVDDLMNHILENIKNKGISIVELASRIDINHNTLYRNLNQDSDMRVSTLIKVLNELKE